MSDGMSDNFDGSKINAYEREKPNEFPTDVTSPSSFPTQQPSDRREPAQPSSPETTRGASEVTEYAVTPISPAMFDSMSAEGAAEYMADVKREAARQASPTTDNEFDLSKAIKGHHDLLKVHDAVLGTQTKAEEADDTASDSCP